MVTKAKVIFLLIFLSFMNLHLFSQVSDSLFDISCQNEDLLILSDEMEVNFVGQKIPLMLVNVSNDLVIVIQNNDGLKKFDHFELPRDFDESYIYHASTVRNIDWSYDDITVDRFIATKTDKTGQPENMKINKTVRKKRVIDKMGFFGFTNIYEYSFEGLNVGDTVQVSYNYKIAFNENWIRLLSNRMFFHGKYPKKSFKLNWCYNKNLEVDSAFNFLDPPEVIVDGNRLCYNWEFNNLPGCLEEPGGRPYRSLPNLVFAPKPYELEYTEYNSYKYVFIPNYFFESAKRQSMFRREASDNVIGIKNKNNLNYHKVANKIISKAPNDTIGIERMRYFQQFMVDSVKYNNAFAYYNHEEDTKRQRAGEDLNGFKVADNNLELVYANMLPKLGLDYFTAYPIDSRSGEISPFYNPTVLDNDLIIASILNNNTIGLAIPRSDKNHYYFEELPFYYEDINVLLIHLVDFANPLPQSFFIYNTADISESIYFDPLVSNFDGGDKRNFNLEFRQWKTPTSELKDNYRKIQSKVNISLENNLAQFKTRVLLSGQFSTLTRCVYCERPVDSTINPKYLVPIWDISEKVTVKDVKPEHPMIYYPFKTSIMTNYEVGDILTQKQDEYILQIGEWFKLVYDEGVNSDLRFLDYYSDFVGSDSFSYMIEFDQPVTLLTGQDTTEVVNEYAHICFVAKQMGDMKILLNCNYDITAKMVGTDFISKVTDINETIETLLGKEIRVKLSE